MHNVLEHNFLERPIRVTDKTRLCNFYSIYERKTPNAIGSEPSQQKKKFQQIFERSLLQSN